MEYIRFQIIDSCQVMQQWIWRKLMCFSLVIIYGVVWSIFVFK